MGIASSWVARVEDGVREGKRSPLEERRGAASGRSGRPARVGAGRRRAPGAERPSSPTSPMPGGRVTAAALRPSRVRSRSVASRPASSPSKARKTRAQPRRAEATRSTPWVPRAAHEPEGPIR